jgi:2-methylisocitrate lyase-like PEP mutase family enzyme
LTSGGYGGCAMTRASELRGLLGHDDILVLPGVADALTARIAEQAGFGAVYVTGAGFANASFGLPDIGLIGLSEVVEHVARIADAVDVPVVVDSDTGYGELLSVRRSVHQLERAGAAAIQFEDQVAPKRCGHFDGQRIVSLDDMVAKISIAVDSRRSDDLVIIARTDARGVDGIDAAVERGNAYAQAGADIIFVEAPHTLDELLSLPARIEAPLLANMVEGGKTPVLSADELAKAGYRIALFANTALRAAMAAVVEVLGALRAQGSSEAASDRIISWDRRQEIVGLTAFQELENRYAFPH